MNLEISLNHTNTVVNGIFSGYYYFPIAGNRKKLYSFSSPDYPIDNFYPPYSAKLLNQTSGDTRRLIAAGQVVRSGCSPVSSRSGVLYFSENTNIVGACHGYGSDNQTYYNGNNFYHAFYPLGYYLPPYGENISIFQANQDGADNLFSVGCNNISITEYNELFGIPSAADGDVGLTTDTLSPNQFAQIVSPQEVCPPDVTIVSYFDEINYRQIAGTTSALGAGDPYNGNPIPTSLDSQDIKVNGRYKLNPIGDPLVGEREVVITGGRAQPSYSNSSITNKLNTVICPANLMETQTSTLRGDNGLQLVDSPDILPSDIGGQVNFVGQEAFHYWHFTFKENADTLPFFNNFPASEGPTTVFNRTINAGTQLFDSVLSAEENYWENRQCPATVDFLPWTYGASIYACPSTHFDIPYYSAIKKYGFYGARFLNTCTALNLDFPISGVPHASELDLDVQNVVEKDEGEPKNLDGGGDWSFSAYDNLLRIAKAEEQYSNMYALNKGFFLWANKSNILQDPNYTQLVNNVPYFEQTFSGLVRVFDDVFTQGLSSFSGNEPSIILNKGFIDSSYLIIDSGKYNDTLLTNDDFIKFKNDLFSIIPVQANRDLWNSIENQYSYYIMDSDGNVNQPFYQNIISGREKRMRTRYFENVLRGNSVDLYPINSIPYSTDEAKSYIESTGWARRSTSFGLHSPLEGINRRYFEGAYGKASAVSGLVEKLNSLASSQVNFYYPGFFQDIRCGKDTFNPTYSTVTGGTILDEQNRSFSPSGWLAVGYNEVGGLDGNFSCFTPIFVQQPNPTVFCKIGQKPTMRSLAVDYHTLPEDKIKRKYPEVMYWAYKLKLLDCKQKPLYPLKYNWYRVLKTDYSNFLASGDFSLAEQSNQTGTWCSFEGNNSPNCTLIHPLDCHPIYSGSSNEDDYTFIQGAKYGVDDNYYYFNVASGRFGVRMSNITELKIENWLSFDVSVRNGMNGGASVGVNFEVEDFNGSKNTISFSPKSAGSLSSYQGYKQDNFAIPESVIQQKVPPPNAGYGDVTAYRFIGPIGYVGETRSFQPSTVDDTRGLRETWGRMTEYGPLVNFYSTLTQSQGNLLYGYKHLPTCEGYSMALGKKGIKANFTLNGLKVSHWSLDQKAVASTDNKIGVQYNKLTTLGDLYPPITSRGEQPNFAIGAWQFANNLGSIKRFGHSSTEKTDDIQLVGVSSTDPDSLTTVIKWIKDNLVKPDSLAGSNCGYTKYGAGRNMLYYIEAFDRFYILCDPIKKKNVTDRSFLNPSLHFGNSSIQYFWLGKPVNTYVSRRSMYGPYAYQWKVNRHNRDRQGNGISEGFYSMGQQEKYSLLYDQPSIYGLYLRPSDPNSSYKNQVNDINTARKILTDGGTTINSIRTIWFGEARGEGTARIYGDIMFSCEANAVSNRNSFCDYVSKAQSLAGSPNLSDYVCPEQFLKQGACFDPCMSMRYAQGFFPGGKLQDLFGYGNQNSVNDPSIHNVRLVPLATMKNGKPSTPDEQSKDDKNIFFRSPLNTPHARISQNTNIGGVSPCQDGGADHCNYTTAIISLGTVSSLLGSTTDFNYIADLATNTYNTNTSSSQV